MGVQKIANSNDYQVTENHINSHNLNLLAKASYEKSVSGWNFLILDSFVPSSSDEQVLVYLAAGILEGYLTCEEIKLSYPNFYADNFGKDLPPAEVVNFIIDNFYWMESQANKNYKDDPFWLSVLSFINQLKGITLGFLHSPCFSLNHNSTVIIDTSFDIRAEVNSIMDKDKISLLHLLLMNAWGDLYTITTKFELQKQEFFSSIDWTDTSVIKSESEVEQVIRKNSDFIRNKKRVMNPNEEIEKDLRCSALFKLTSNFSDVLFGHATWGSFIALGPRVMKTYNLPSSSLNEEGELSVEMRKISFSSSPGLLASLDDFYVITSESTKLAVLETTNDLLNPSLFPLVTAESCLCWMRVIVANSLAFSGDSWSKLFSTHPSGTYTNQWMVMDWKRFIPGQVPSEGFFTVLEEIPSLIIHRDMTDLLVSKSYWPSYNVPFFPEIYIRSGNKLACDLHNHESEYCYDSCSRAAIFNQRQNAVESLSDFKYLINYNNWQVDPLSANDSCKAIACRRDLENKLSNRYPSGGLDAKVTSISTIEQPSQNGSAVIHIRLGPTNDDQPSFCWSQLEKEYIHFGQPDCFDYPWTQFHL